jgi:phenylalanine-4-hydroxylase
MAGNPNGYSPVARTGGAVEVQLDGAHPGFADPEYRARRNAIAALSVDHRPGEPVPAVDYSDVEHDVWRTVARELKPKHERLAATAFLHGAEDLALPDDHIPQLDEVTGRLRALTGFHYEPVAGLAPLRTFYQAFTDRTFFSTQYIRHHSVPLYTPEPDIVHEVIGHANQLANPVFADLYTEVGLAVLRTETDEALRLLSKVFWFTLEFGVMWEGSDLKAYGAGILSSFGELDAFRDAEIRPLDVAEIGARTYDITRYQPVLYAAHSPAHLLDTLHDFFGRYDDEVHARVLRRASRLEQAASARR